MVNEMSVLLIKVHANSIMPVKGKVFLDETNFWGLTIQHIYIYEINILPSMLIILIFLELQFIIILY